MLPTLPSLVDTTFPPEPARVRAWSVVRLTMRTPSGHDFWGKTAVYGVNVGPVATVPRGHQRQTPAPLKAGRHGSKRQRPTLRRSVTPARTDDGRCCSPA